MTLGGWINLILSVGFVTTLFAYCLIRVLRSPRSRSGDELAHIEPIGEDEADRR